MAVSGMMMKLLCMGVMCMALITPHAEGAISCDTVYSTLYPCLNYVLGNGPIQESCCNGIRSIYTAAQTTGDRQSVCACLKQVASSTTRINFNNAAGLPGKCGVNLPYKISPTIDCKTVS